MYFLHWPDRTGVPLEETWGAMAELVEQGLVRAIGMSNYDLADVMRCHAHRTVDVVQIGLSLIDYLDVRDDIARYGEAGIAVTVFDVLGGGILTGKTIEEVLATWTGPWLESGFFKRLLVPRKAERSFAVAEGLRPIADRLGATMAQVAIAWVLHQPGVTAALAGSRSPRHTQENAQSVHVALTDSLAEIERLALALQPSTQTLSPRPPTARQQNQPAWVLQLGGVRERRRGLAADNRGGLVNQFVIV
jgi:aryl-alcohol dehydrogenase-like predicted oxidoreductase